MPEQELEPEPELVPEQELEPELEPELVLEPVGLENPRPTNSLKGMQPEIPWCNQ